MSNLTYRYREKSLQDFKHMLKTLTREVINKYDKYWCRYYKLSIIRCNELYTSEHRKISRVAVYV